MDLLSKFDAVTVTPDNRITAQDKAFCAAHQAAYDAARASLEKLIKTWKAMQAEQQAAMQGIDNDPDKYLTSGTLRISVSAIRNQIALLHVQLIHNLVGHFNMTYHIRVSAHDIKKNLLPAEPDGYRASKEQQEQYDQQMQSISLHSDQIVEQILEQLDGRSLWEQALYELRCKCHRAAWNLHSGKPEFTLSKNVIHFSCGCTYDGFYPAWHLMDDMKTILRSLAHYETGEFGVTPMSFSSLLGYNHVGAETVPFPDCQKAAKLRMFKNRRVDLTFLESRYAEEFVEKYLGSVC